MIALIIVKILSVLLAPIDNFGIDKILILLKIFICILIIQTYVNIEFLMINSNLLVLLCKNNRIIFNILDILILIKIFIFKHSL